MAEKMSRGTGSVSPLFFEFHLGIPNFEQYHLRVALYLGDSRRHLVPHTDDPTLQLFAVVSFPPLFHNAQKRAKFHRRLCFTSSGSNLHENFHGN